MVASRVPQMPLANSGVALRLRALVSVVFPSGKEDRAVGRCSIRVGVEGDKLMDWAKKVEDSIADQRSQQDAVTARREAALAMEPELRREAAANLKSAVEVLDRHSVPATHIFTRHEGSWPELKSDSLFRADDGLIEVMSSLLKRDRRDVYIAPDAPSVKAWSFKSKGGAPENLFLTIEGRMVEAHNLPIGEYGPRGPSRKNSTTNHSGWCGCSNPKSPHLGAEPLRLCFGFDRLPPHDPHLELNEYYEGAMSHGQPFGEWLSWVIARLVADGRP